MNEPNRTDQPHERRGIPREMLAVMLIVALAIGAAVVLSGRPTGSGRSSAESPDPASFRQPTVSARSGQALTVGETAPDFTLKALGGQDVTLSSLQGHPVLINFWASWCAPCRVEMPDLVRTYEAHKADGLVILAINTTFQDSVPDAQAFAKEFNMIFPVLLDETGAVARDRYRLRGLPVSFFVDRQGIIVRRQIGAMSSKQIDTFVGEIVQ